MFSLVQNLTSALRAHKSDGFHNGNDRQKQTKFGSVSVCDDDEKPTLIERDYFQVSVQSLIRFFEEYLESCLDRKQKHTAAHHSKPWMTNDHSNSNDGISSDKLSSPRKTAGIYGMQTDTCEDFVLSRMKNNDIRDELKEVYVLIQDLRILRNQGIDNIVISHDQPFISAVRTAAEAMKDAS